MKLQSTQESVFIVLPVRSCGKETWYYKIRRIRTEIEAVSEECAENKFQDLREKKVHIQGLNYLYYATTIYGAITWKRMNCPGTCSTRLRYMNAPPPKKKLENMSVRH